MVSCSILHCVSDTRQKHEDVTFHRFPRNKTTRQKWIAATGRKNWNPAKNSRICSKHFEQFHFRKTPRKVFLWKYASPTLLTPVPVNTGDTEPGPSKRTRHDSNSSSDSDSNEKVIEQCRFCAEYSKDCIDTCYIPFLMENKAFIVFNDLSIKLDFTDNALPQTVCRDCNSKLQEMINFIIQVTEAQKKFKVEAKSNRKVYDFKNESIKKKETKKQTIKSNEQTYRKDDDRVTNDAIGIKIITKNYDDDEDTRDAFEHRDIKVEYESPTDEDLIRDTHTIKTERESDDTTEITDSLPAEEPMFFKGFKRKNEDTAIAKKAKVISEEEVEIKEEVTNDAIEDYHEVQLQYDSESARTGNVTPGTVTTENVTPGTVTTENVTPGTITTGIGASSALASVKYITIDGTTGRFSVEPGNKRMKIE
ncbi:uncharacterized protein LOC133532184 isoform X2 [Cydia pomonella]|uniref:uncharacterized protein LOC133532184 isoform X2 n=1 Tax=Cydia pomonella TaxID=82600 RepID=UPI002ADE1050|nr:uncharacterized protein LOC133532184 isoform X2 [Cydia pomonella]